MSESNTKRSADKLLPSVSEYFQLLRDAEGQRAQAEQLRLDAAQELIDQCNRNVDTLAKFGMRFEFREFKRPKRVRTPKPETESQDNVAA